MHQIFIAESASKDLLEIRSYLESVNVTASLRYHELFLDAIDLLAKMPRAGRVRSDLFDDGTRSWTVYPYVILYRFDGQVVRVWRVVHGARDLGNLNEESR